jgi:hypothetical protein
VEEAWGEEDAEVEEINAGPVHLPRRTPLKGLKASEGCHLRFDDEGGTLPSLPPLRWDIDASYASIMHGAFVHMHGASMRIFPICLSRRPRDGSSHGPSGFLASQRRGAAGLATRMHLTFRGAPVTTDPSRGLMGVQPFVNAGERRACVAGACVAFVLRAASARLGLQIPSPR